jgi:hypothetical protein
MRGHYADNAKPRPNTTNKAYFDMETWLIFLGGMTVACGCAALLAAITDWVQKKLDEWNTLDDERREQQEQQLNDY